MVQMIAKQRFAYDGHNIVADQKFEARQVDVQILEWLGRAELAENPGATQAVQAHRSGKGRQRRYERRDMVPKT